MEGGKACASEGTERQAIPQVGGGGVLGRENVPESWKITAREERGGVPFSVLPNKEGGNSLILKQ